MEVEGRGFHHENPGAGSGESLSLLMISLRSIVTYHHIIMMMERRGWDDGTSGDHWPKLNQANSVNWLAKWLANRLAIKIIMAWEKEE